MTGQGRPHFDSSQITGIVGEHLAVVDLLKRGYQSSLAGANFPYDVVTEINNRLYRVQVKSTACCYINKKGRVRPGEYIFTMHYKNKGCDIVAFVATDVNTVAYLPAYKCDHRAMKFKAPNYVAPKGYRRQKLNLDEYTIENAIKELHQHEKEKENIL